MQRPISRNCRHCEEVLALLRGEKINVYTINSSQFKTPLGLIGFHSRFASKRSLRSAVTDAVPINEIPALIYYRGLQSALCGVPVVWYKPVEATIFPLGASEGITVVQLHKYCKTHLVGWVERIEI